MGNTLLHSIVKSIVPVRVERWLSQRRTRVIKIFSVFSTDEPITYIEMTLKEDNISYNLTNHFILR